MAELAFLLVEDDTVLARWTARMLERFGAVHVAGTVAEARLAIDARSWSALFVDVGLPDGSGLDAIAYARASQKWVPALVLTGRGDAATANRAFELGVPLVRKPVEVPLIEAFLRAVKNGNPSVRDRFATVAERWRELYLLTPAETAVLRWAMEKAVGGIIPTHRAIAEARGCTPHTVKKHAQNIISKTGDTSFISAVQRALQGTN
jgi:DNA-binding NarL/FixJ family response regulator